MADLMTGSDLRSELVLEWLCFKLIFYVKDESDDEGGDSSDSDVSSKPERPETVEFVLGRFCARRTKVYHTFTHWEVRLLLILMCCGRNNSRIVLSVQNDHTGSG